MGWNDERSVPSQPPTEPPSARPCPRSSRECGRRTQPQHRIAAHGDDDRLLRSLAQDAMQLAPKDGEARSLSLVTPPHRANEDRHLVDARRDKLLASGRTHPEFGQLIAKTGRSNACRHADNRRRARPPKQGNVCTSVREQTGKRLSRGVESPPRAPAFVGVGVRWPSRSFTSTSERVDRAAPCPVRIPNARTCELRVGKLAWTPKSAAFERAPCLPIRVSAEPTAGSRQTECWRSSSPRRTEIQRRPHY